MMRSCKACNLLTEGEVCPSCQGKTSQYWSGYLGVVRPEKSEIAKRMEKKVPGQYSLKVR